MFAIYCTTTAQAYASHYFTKPDWYQPGPTRRCILPVLASQATQRSYMIAKDCPRVREQRKHWQHGGRHKQGKRAYRDAYVIESVNWRVISIGWDKNDVVEHSNHDTREMAVIACRAAHAKAGH